jgi:hypothetical protein
MKLPQLNLRIPADYHQLIRDIAQRLRERDAASFAHELDAFLIGLPSAPPMAGAELAARVDALEDTVAKLAQMITKQVMEVPTVAPKLNAPYPDEVLAQANDLNNQGMTWEAVWKALGEPGTVNGLRNAVGKRRKRAA